MARHLILAALVTMFSAFAAWLALHDPAHLAPAGSVDRRGGDGLALALAYLRARTVVAEPLHQPLTAGVVPARAVVLRLTPRRALAGPAVSPAEHAWISAGGRLVVADDGSTAGETDDDEDRPSSIPPLPPLPSGPPAPLAWCLPLWPGVVHLEPQVPRALAHPRGAVILRLGAGAMITLETIGAGELIRLTCADCLTDARLAKADHLALLHALAAVGSGREVRFDEYALGRSDSPQFDLIRRLGLTPVLYLTLAIFAVWAWRRSVTNGPVDGPPPEQREDAIELVDSLGELLGEHLDDRALLDAYHERLRGLVARRSGLRGADLEQHLRALLGPPPPSTGRQAFRLHLDQLNAAFERALHERPG